MPGGSGAGKTMVLSGPRHGGLEMPVQGVDSQVVKAFSPGLLPDHGPEGGYDGTGNPKGLPLPSDRAAEQMLERLAESPQGGGPPGRARDPQP